MSTKILILFTHPRFEQSQNNALLLQRIKDIPEITINDLYEKYPDFDIDTEHEKSLLQDHNVIVWQHPFYWYSAPPLMKHWIELVLEFGWAYGPGGNALKGKLVFNCITTGMQKSAYTRGGQTMLTLRELLVPFERTALQCNMEYLPPFVVHGTHRISKDERWNIAGIYREILEKIINGDFTSNEIKKFTCLNDWFINIKPNYA